MKNGDRPVSAIVNEDGFCTSHSHLEQPEGGAIGLTKREYFAGLAMSGILSAYSEALAHGRMPDPSEYVKDCVIAADALLAELEKP